MTRSVDVVHVGSACRDISADDPRGWRLGGGVAYAALTTARLGLRTVALVGADEATASATELDLLRATGVDVRIQPLDAGPVFENRETAAGRVQICHVVGQPLRVPFIEAEWMAAPGWSIVPVADEIGDTWTTAIPDHAYVALGWQGLLRDLHAGRQVGRRAPLTSSLIRRADLVGVSRSDLDPSTDEGALARFMKPGADLLLTDGVHGGHLFRMGVDQPEAMRPYRPKDARQIDPTGAGDTFLAALLASVLRPDPTTDEGRRGQPDLSFAAAAGALVVEGVGLAAVPDRGAVVRRAARPS
jgi:sugar/nucleoside kinase (ribokinase family)